METKISLSKKVIKNNEFKAEIEVDHGTIHLFVTHNGLERSSLRIYDPLHEIPRIIELLARQLESSIADLKLGK